MKASSRIKSVFISYDARARRGVDSGWLMKLSDSLRERGFKVHSPWQDTPAGENWAQHVATALDDADAMVVLLAGDSARSPWVKREIDYALVNERFAQRLIPVLLPESDPDQIPWILETMPMLKADKSASATANRIAAALSAPAAKPGHSAA